MHTYITKKLFTKWVEGVVQVFRGGEDESTQCGVKRYSILVVIVVAQKWKVRAHMVVHQEVDSFQIE